MIETIGHINWKEKKKHKINGTTSNQETLHHYRYNWQDKKIFYSLGEDICSRLIR